MSWQRRIMATALLLGSSLCAATQDASPRLFVAPDGNDRNPGTLAEPLATLQAAVGRAEKSLRRCAASRSEAFHIVLMDGVYRQAAPVELSGRSFSRKRRLVIRAQNEGRARLSGAVLLPPVRLRPAREASRAHRLFQENSLPHLLAVDLRGVAHTLVGLAGVVAPWPTTGVASWLEPGDSAPSPEPVVSRAAR